MPSRRPRSRRKTDRHRVTYIMSLNSAQLIRGALQPPLTRIGSDRGEPMRTWRRSDGRRAWMKPPTWNPGRSQIDRVRVDLPAPATPATSIRRGDAIEGRAAVIDRASMGVPIAPSRCAPVLYVPLVLAMKRYAGATRAAI